MDKKISYSAWDKYMTCPHMYYLHYVLKLRPIGPLSSALLFGASMDEGLNKLLLDKDLEGSLRVFRECFNWDDCKDILWDDRDLDESLIDQSMLTESKKYDNPRSWLSWACMRIKGRMFLEEYYNEVYPLIEEVYHVQRKLHSRPGFIDAIVKLRGYGRVLLDHKTSSQSYNDNAVTDSPQLALYAKDHGLKKVGFIVFNKQIQKNTKKICKLCSFNGSFVQHKTCPQINNGKRCHGKWTKTYNPKAKIQILVEDLPEINGELIEQSLCQVEKGIKNEVYPRNLKACGKIYGKPCQYINYCWKGDKTGLEIKEDNEPKNKGEKNEFSKNSNDK